MTGTWLLLTFVAVVCVAAVVCAVSATTYYGSARHALSAADRKADVACAGFMAVCGVLNFVLAVAVLLAAVGLL